MDVEEESEEAHSPQKTSTLHAHRLDHNPSKLPAFRFVDLNGLNGLNGLSRLSPTVSSFVTPNSESASAAALSTATTQGPSLSTGDDFNIPAATTTLSTYSPARRPSSSPAASTVGTYFPQSPSQQAIPSFSSRLQDKRARRAPASHSSNGIETATGPPPALSTQRSSAAEAPRTPATSTTEWALAQQQLAYQTLNTATTSSDGAPETDITPRTPRGASKSLDESSSSRPLIPPIRSFRSSATRASLEMQAKAMYRYEESHGADQDGDRDRTLRALEGFSDGERKLRHSHAMVHHDDHTQADPASEDLFLNIARDDQDNTANGENFSRTERRRSRIALPSGRQSLIHGPTAHQQSPTQPMSRRGSDAQASPLIASGDDYLRNPRNGSALSTHRYPPLSRSHPSTPRGDAQFSSGGRRSSIPDSNASVLSRSHAYRQSNLSYSTPRIYNSSPLVARQKEVEDGFDTPRLPEGTESTVSTTAPSTVWDELDDLKSRIRKLELTGKLPPTSGAAISRASAERPPTATTTITTMSTSPKRGRGLSTSPVESNIGGQLTGDVHPLLHSALAKSKSLVHPEVYKALEATASDALSIAAMTGSLGQIGPVSAAQSVIGSGMSTVVPDRQLRRKADGLCRSLTELCIALSEVRPEVAQAQHQETSSQVLVRPMSRDRESVHGGLESSQRSGDGLARMKTNSRVPSRLEARRSSLLATSTLPTPRYTTPDAPTPTQSVVATRRTSVLLRSRRAGTDEPEEEESRFRAPSRAVTEIVRSTRNSPREYTSQQPLPETRPPSIQSSLPLRRNYVSTNLNSPSSQDKPLPNPVVTNRRFLDRSTPERDMTNNNSNNHNMISRLAEDRGHRAHGTVSALAYEGTGLGMGRAKSLTKSRPRPQLRERLDTEVSID